MRYVEKTQTWNDDWNNVIRDVIFQDEKFKELQCVPQGTSIVQFIDKYFIENGASDELLTDEIARVVYCDTLGRDTGNKNVRLKYKEFDIYVKEDWLYNIGIDRLKSRISLIAERLKYLQLNQTFICGIHFSFEDEYDLWTKTVGYRRYRIAFSYKISV